MIPTQECRWGEFTAKTIALPNVHLDRNAESQAQRRPPVLTRPGVWLGCLPRFWQAAEREEDPKIRVRLL